MNLFAAAFSQIANCLIREGVEVAGGYVRCELLVPCLGIELREPITKGRKLLAGELADSGLYLSNGAHGEKIAARS